jgi:nucleotide-binding universal stress UspA family protein
MYRKILVATDGSDLAGKAVDHGISLAKATGATVVFVTVTGMWSAFEIAAESEQGVKHPMETYEAMARNAAHKILSGCEDRAKADGVAFETVHVSDSPPADGIIATATEKGCDLIVMASHGRRGIKRMMLGSQTAEVLADGTVPVLVLR